MTLQRLTRVFKKGITKLLDPDPAMTPEQVLEHYTDLFPELANATVSEPETVGNELVYTFEKPMVKTKGSDETVNVQKHLSLLGIPVEDRVTGFKGVATGVSFDLYGCVQVIVNPGVDGDGKPRESHWFDIARLNRTSEKPVMNRPDFDFGRQAEGRQGCADKPRLLKP